MDFDYFNIVIDREAIEKVDFSMIKTFIEKFDNEKLLLDATGTLNISFYGYDEDPREIFEIPEIQNWVKTSMIVEKIPWFFFLSTEPTSQNIKALTLCFIAEQVETTDGTIRYQPMQKNLQNFAMLNFQNMNYFMHAHQLSEDMKTEISEKVNGYFENWLNGNK
jgi:hypothetical protein